MEYVYLNNRKRARSVAFAMTALSIVLTIINIVLIFTGSKRNLFINCSIAVNMISIMVLLIFCMHYLWANGKNKYLNIIMHLMQLHLLVTIFALFVGDFSSFSFTFIHAILDSILMCLICLLIDRKCKLVFLLIISIVTFVLVLFQLNRILNILMLIFSILLILISLITENKSVTFVFAIVLGFVTAICSFFALKSNFEFNHVIMHFLINNVGILLNSIFEKKGGIF